MAEAPIPATPPGESPSPIQTRKPFVGLNPSNVPPSQYIFLQDNDWITVGIFITNASQTVRINYRFLTPTGEIKEGTFVPAPLAPGGFNNFTFQIGEGWLLSIALQQTSLVLAGNWCWAQLGFTRSQIAGTPVQGFIWEGFVYFNASSGWPGVGTKEFGDGPGNIVSITGSTPAAGADISESMPSLRRRQLLALRASLVTSATVANRFPQFLFDDGSNVFFGAGTNVAQTASQATAYQASPGLTFFADSTGDVLIPAPSPLFLKGTYRIRTSTLNLQVGDQWSAPKYLVAEWGAIDQ